ncbi:hypothetical protein UlMin_011283 [Ulmus minor]
MSSCSNTQSTKVGYLGDQNAFPTITNLSECHEDPSKPEEDDEDEDEDFDFNPFLKEAPSPAASSSLSSDIEALHSDAIESSIVGLSSTNLNCDKQNCKGDSEYGVEEVVMQTVSSEGPCEKELEKTVQDNYNGSSSMTDANDLMVGELVNTTDSRKPVIDLDTEDAICTRTRARYSLASFTLDELETFLQETDDEDDLQNVDDEEEYNKFLAAVLQGGDGDCHSAQENEIVDDDDDEDNDADFEIELEEALESDIDEGARDKTEHEIGGRRPETRQNKRQRASSQSKKKLLVQAKRPLRPLFPVLPNGPISSFSTQNGRMLMPETVSSSLSSSVEVGSVNGFTQQQIGQLHCLIHEHAQLLIQIFSLSVLDSSRQEIASQVKKLITEMLHKRDEVQTWKTVSYPSTCFCPEYVGSSLQNDFSNFLPNQCTLISAPGNATHEDCSPNKWSEGRPERASNSPAGFSQNIESIFWVPYINGPLLTILDVAPLSLVGKYLNDVETAVQESRRRQVETSCDTCFEREPLFPLPGLPVFASAKCEVSNRTSPTAMSTVSSSPSKYPPKKTLAATLVESTKKQSVALVPREIANLCQRFFPMFNPALFPHKPPPSAVANRVLFTDAEDELLALGIMEYNTDWKAIRQRFLPCKNDKQIFVRQKNRCSSKAPENSIKAVRKMKTSPLSVEEIMRIQEGLKVYKYDWITIWKLIVPHRDPSLLPRQWRVAIGTQKSYKLDEVKKEKRRLYEKNRRKCKTADLTGWQNKEDCQVENSGGDNDHADVYTDNAGKTYVHEAFLADWRPTNPVDLVRNIHGGMLPQDAFQEHLRKSGWEKAPSPQTGYGQQFPSLLKYSQHPTFHSYSARHSGPSNIELNNSVSHMDSNASKSLVYLRPYRARRSSGAHLVKLAPGLPPVNLPPSARVVSQSAFRGSLHIASNSVSAEVGGIGDIEKESLVSQVPQAGRLGTPHIIKGRHQSNPPNDSLTSLHTDESISASDKIVEEERGTDCDLQMHPLLFQAPEEGQLPYYPLNCGSTVSSSFSFFSGNQPQLNLSLLHNPHEENHVASFTKSFKSKESNTASSGIDFHPLLQRADYVNSESETTCSNTQISVGVGCKLQHPSDAAQTEVHANGRKHSGTNEKANELDLEIHLSSASRKENSEGRDPRTNNSVQSTISALDSGFTPAENVPSNCSNLVVDGHTSVISSTSISGYVDTADQSHPEIVMEQEELSDSDEEDEENVEFECEEMADSEVDEGSGCEQLTEMQTEEGPSPAMRKSVTADCDDNQGETRGNFHIPGKSIPSLDDASNSSWLSLDSSRSKHGDSTIRGSPATKSLASSRPGRSCKKRKQSTKEVMAEKQSIEGKEQLNSVPPARKRSRRSTPSMNIGLTEEHSNFNGEDNVS